MYADSADVVKWGIKSERKGKDEKRY